MIELTKASLPFWNNTTFLFLGIMLVLIVIGSLFFLIFGDGEDKIMGPMILLILGAVIFFGGSALGWASASAKHENDQYAVQLEEAGYSKVDVNGSSFIAVKDGEYVSGNIVTNNGRRLAIEVPAE